MSEPTATPQPVLPNPETVERHIGRNIRQRRIALGISQERLGGQIGRTFQQIQKYENGANRVSAGRLYQIARVLGLPPGEFFAGLPFDGTAGVPEAPYRRDALELAKAFARIADPELRAAVLELVRSIAECSGDAAEEAPEPGTPYARRPEVVAPLARILSGQ